jgi:hypothetical protein
MIRLAKINMLTESCCLWKEIIKFSRVCCRLSLFREQITDLLGVYIGKFCLAELIVKLVELEQNVHRRMGWRLTFYSLAVSSRTTKLHIQKLYMALALR